MHECRHIAIISTIYFLSTSYPQTTSLRVTPGKHVNDALSNVEMGVSDIQEAREDSSYYDKSNKDSPLHRFSHNDLGSLNKGEHQVGER